MAYLRYDSKGKQLHCHQQLRNSQICFRGEAGSHRGYVRYIHGQCDRLGCELCKPLNTGTGWCGLEIGGFRCVGCVGVCGYVLVMV